MQNSLRLLFFVLMFTCVAEAQIVYHDAGPKDDSTEVVRWFSRAQALSDSLMKSGVIVQEVDILQKQENVFLLIDGRFDVWLWENSTSRWKNLYQGHHHGYNYLAKKWLHKGEILSFGGYGFWQKHGHVIHFNLLDSQWEMHEQSLEIPFGTGYIRNDTLIVLADSIYEYDLTAHQVVSASPNTFFYVNLAQKPFGMIETKDYLLLANDNSLIYKPTKELYISDSISRLPTYTHRLISSCLWIHDNSLNVFTKDLVSAGLFDLDKEIKQFHKVKSTVTSNHRKHATWILLGLGFPLLLVFLMFQRNKNSNVEKTPLPSTPQMDMLRLKILSFAGQTFTVEQLDELFGLNQPMPPDSLRFKRFQYIRDINENYLILTGKHLIVRERDPDDGRRFVYLIQQ
ncbi:MAG: hypothetical protein LW630_04910 [Saprospiraceae bacterium]|nr:hypothetical protein [Saprospiraceae bacterium]